MKKIILTILLCLTLTGCEDKTNFQDIVTYTTIYPIEYIANTLYNDYSNIKSIYPNGVNLEEYSLTEKQKNNYSKEKTFIYNGLSNEVRTAVDFLNKNENLQIIDGMKNMNYKYGIEELWLDPSHYLMVARNIKESLIDYETNVYRRDNIEQKYNDLKIAISEIDVELTLIGKNASYKNIVVANNVLEYLSKYNINVLSVDQSNTNYEKNLNEAKKLAGEKSILYVYKLKNHELNETIKGFATTYNLEVIDIETMENLTEAQRKESKNYITLMGENIDNLKKELLK